MGSFVEQNMLVNIVLSGEWYVPLVVESGTNPVCSNSGFN